MKPIDIFLNNGYKKTDQSEKERQVKITRKMKQNKLNYFSKSIAVFDNLVTEVFSEREAEKILSMYPLKPFYFNKLILTEILPNALRYSLRSVQKKETLKTVTILHNNWSVPLFEWKEWNKDRDDMISKIKKRVQRAVKGNLNGIFFIELTPSKISGAGKKELSILPHIHGIVWGAGKIIPSVFKVNADQKAVLYEDVFNLIGWQEYFLKPQIKLKRNPKHGGDTMPQYIFYEYAKQILDLDVTTLFFTKGKEARNIWNNVKIKMQKQLDEIK